MKQEATQDTIQCLKALLTNKCKLTNHHEHRHDTNVIGLQGTSRRRTSVLKFRGHPKRKTHHGRWNRRCNLERNLKRGHSSYCDTSNMNDHKLSEVQRKYKQTHTTKSLWKFTTA